MMTQWFYDSSIQKFYGLSTDTKPSGCSNGSVFLELDTCTIYIYNKDGDEWNAIPIGGGGSSDVVNYNNALNKPSINGVTLQGNKTLSALGIASSSESNVHSAALAEIVDASNKNYLTKPNTQNEDGVKWIEIPINIPSGNWVLSFSSVTSTDTDATYCRGRLYDSNYNGTSSYFSVPRGSDSFVEVTTTGTSAYLRINPSDTLDHSAGDTVTLTDGMLCSKADWDVSHSYVPYKYDIARAVVFPKYDQTDMSAEILSKLTMYGHCELQAGTYYVSGFEMPEGATIVGKGKNTVLKLLDDVTDGYCLRINRTNVVANISFSGGDTAPSNIDTQGAIAGNRNGIYLAANADGSGSSRPTSETNIIYGCFFDNFDGSAFLTRNTGGNWNTGVIMTSCRISRCMVGINIDYNAEYSKYSDIIMSNCNIACLNGGGNNAFVNCTFHGVKGFVIDASGGDKPNCSHGSVVSCIFNHIDKVNHPEALGGGLAIEIKNAPNGFIFSGCQIWYGSISITSSKGIQLSNCLIGGGAPEITVSGDYGAFFDGCIFQNAPSLTLNSRTRFDNCYNGVTGEHINPSQALIACVDGESKNKMPVASGSGAQGEWFEAAVTLRPGDYVVSFQSLSSTHASQTTCRIGFLTSGGSWAASFLQMPQGANVSLPVKITQDAVKIRIQPASTVGDTANTDVVSFSGAMICPQEIWSVSNKYVPYCPTMSEMWDAIKELQQG